MLKASLVLVLSSLLSIACGQKQNAESVRAECSDCGGTQSAVSRILSSGVYKLTYRESIGMVPDGAVYATTLTARVDRSAGGTEALAFDSVVNQADRGRCVYFSTVDLARIERDLTRGTLENVGEIPSDGASARLTISDGRSAIEYVLLPEHGDQLVLSTGASLSQAFRSTAQCPPISVSK